MIFHTPFPWHHGCAISHVSITHVTRHTTPAQSLRAGGGLAFRHACIPPDTQGLHAEARHLTQGTAWAYSLTLSSHTPSAPRSHTLFLSLSPFVSPSWCPTPLLTLPVTLVHADVFSLHPRPRRCVRFALPLPSSCLPTSVSLPRAHVPG